MLPESAGMLTYAAESCSVILALPAKILHKAVYYGPNGAIDIGQFASEFHASFDHKKNLDKAM